MLHVHVLKALLESVSFRPNVEGDRYTLSFRDHVCFVSSCFDLPVLTPLPSLSLVWLGKIPSVGCGGCSSWSSSFLTILTVSYVVPIKTSKPKKLKTTLQIYKVNHHCWHPSSKVKLPKRQHEKRGKEPCCADHENRNKSQINGPIYAPEHNNTCEFELIIHV